MKTDRILLACAFNLLGLTRLALAQTTLYWDTNYTTAGCGNSGSSWEGVNWTTDSTGASATSLWTNGSNVVFSAGTDGTGGWTVNLGSTVSTPSIVFAQTGTKTIGSGGTINIGGGTINSTALGFAAGNGDDININSVLAGSGGLTIAAHGDATSDNGGGGGAEFRLGATNTFSGGLTITSGLVSWTTDSNLGDSSNEINLNGGGILVTGSSHTTTRNLKIGASGGSIRTYGSSNLYLNGTIANAPGVASTTLRRTDGGWLYISTTGAGFTGTFRIGGGEVHLTQANADWSKTDFVIPSGSGKLYPEGGGTAVVNSLNTSADVIINNGTTLDVDTGAITMNTGHWYKNTAGAMGMLTSSSGTLTITNGSPTGNLTTNDHQIVVPVVNSGATPVALVKSNNNSLVLAQANTYTGGTTINGGRVQATNLASFGTGTVTVNSGGQAWPTASGTFTNNFVLNGNGVTEGVGTLGAIRFSNVVQLNGSVQVASAARITSYSASDKGTLAGPLTGSAALEKTGSGTVVISGNATGYTGTLTANGGLLKLDSDLGGSLVVKDGTALAGEGSLAGTLTLGATAGSILYLDAATSDALATSNLTVNGVNTVNLATLPATPGSPVDVFTYTGTLTMTGTAADHFALAGAASYRGVPSFADTGTAITLTIPVGADLIWKGTDPTNPTWWDTNVTVNWNNMSVDDRFYSGDNVTFDDTATNKTVAMQAMLNPGVITFNNSVGNDYNLTGGGGVGFTGGTRIVKNNTGTVTIQGYGHNYTGTVTINDGVLKANGYEMLGNSLGVTINNSVSGGGQLDLNGMNLGSGTRHYTVTIAGAGANGLGAITNSSGSSPYENAGLLNLILSDNASVGGPGGRFDIGRSGGAFGTITGNGFVLTKVGSGSVCMRAPATDLTYVVNAGTLKFEDYDTATGPNPITVNAGTLQSYGNRSFSNPIYFAAGTTLDNDGGGNQTWTGPITLTGLPADTVNLNARSGAITVSGAISGNSNINVNGNNILSLAGGDSNTYVGNTTVASVGQLVLSKTGGAVAVPGDLYMSATGTRAIVSATQDNQFGPNSVLRFTGANDTRLELKGTTQTLAGLDNTGATGGYQCIQQSEFGSPANVDGVSDLVLNVPTGGTYTYSGVIRDNGGLLRLTKSGPGTQKLFGGLLDFNGQTTVTEGRLTVNSDDSWTVGVEVAAGAFYEANVTSTSDTFENRHGPFTLTGAGTYEKTGVGNMSMGWDGNASVAMASGGLIDIKEGVMRLEYGGLTTWTTNKGDLHIAAGAALDLWDNNNDGVFVDALTGEGSVVRSLYGQTGTLTVGVDNGSGTFSGTISNASGTTHLVKTGTGTQTLTGPNTYTGNTTVNGGTLELAPTGSLAFAVTDAGSNKIAGTGAVLLDGSFAIDTSAVTVTTGTWTLVQTGTLAETFGTSFALSGPGWSQTDDVWTKTDGDKIWTFTEATGVLELTEANTYAHWIDGFFPGETDPDIIGATADPDHDGIANGVEMVLGGNPATGMDAALLPTIELVSDPVGLPSGDYILFTYRRTDDSVAAGLVAACEYDADLVAPWTTAVDGIDGVAVQVDDNYASFVPPVADTDRVRVYVPLGANPMLYGRLNVTVP